MKLFNLSAIHRMQKKQRFDLIKKYKLSDIQAQAILDMPLRRLAALERRKIEDEYKELTAFMKELEELLKSDQQNAGFMCIRIISCATDLCRET